MKHLFLFISLILLLSCQSVSSDYHLVYVQDGDSAVICCNKGKNFTVRLADIDAPEKHQPYANKSKAALKAAIADKNLVLLGAKKDKYGRWLVDIEVDGKSVNQMMLRQGHAWLWRFSKSKKLKKLQQEAQMQKLGLWALAEKDRIEPFLWRKQNPRK